MDIYTLYKKIYIYILTVLLKAKAILQKSCELRGSNLSSALTRSPSLAEALKKEE